MLPQFSRHSIWKFFFRLFAVDVAMLFTFFFFNHTGVLDLLVVVVFFYTPRRYSTFMWSINFIGSVTYSLCMEFDGRALNCKAYNIYLSIIKCETHSKIIKLDHISAIVYKLQSKLYLLDLYKLDFNSIRRMALLIILWLSNQTIVLSQLTF